MKIPKKSDAILDIRYNISEKLSAVVLKLHNAEVQAKFLENREMIEIVDSLFQLVFDARKYASKSLGDLAQQELSFDKELAIVLNGIKKNAETMKATIERIKQCKAKQDQMK